MTMTLTWGWSLSQNALGSGPVCKEDCWQQHVDNWVMDGEDNEHKAT